MQVICPSHPPGQLSCIFSGPPLDQANLNMPTMISCHLRYPTLGSCHASAEQGRPSGGAGLGLGLIGVEGKPTGNTFRPPPGFMDGEVKQDAAPSDDPQVHNLYTGQALPSCNSNLYQEAWALVQQW